jgi:DNA polymerase I-like protein with 3'-5' exonuclease and polymerase domains
MNKVYTYATNRTGFIAPEGYAYVSTDYKSQEIAVVGVVSGDQEILNTFRVPAKILSPSGETVRNPAADIYAIACSASFEELKDIPDYSLDSVIRYKCPEGSKKTYRDVGKQQVLAAVYGQSAEGAAILWGIPLEEAKRRNNLFYKKFFRLKEWLTETGAICEAQGWSSTKLGRIRCVREENSKGKEATALTGINTQIQGLSAQITKRAVRLTYDYLRPYGGMPCIPVHDELLGIIKTPLIMEAVLDEAASLTQGKEVYTFKYKVNSEEGQKAVTLFEKGMTEAAIEVLNYFYKENDLDKICRVESAVSKYWEH